MNPATLEMARTIGGYVARWKNLLAGIVLTAAAVAALELVWIGLVVPLLSMVTGRLDRDALPGIVSRLDGLFAGFEGADRLWALIWTIVVVALVRGACGALYAWLVATLQTRTNRSVKVDLARKIFGLGLLDFQRYRMSDLTVYIGPQSHNVGQMLQTILTPLPQAFSLLSVLAVCFLLNVRLTLLAAALFGVVAVAFRPLLRRQQELARREKERFKQTLFLSSDTLGGFKSIALASRQDWFRRRLEGELVALSDLQRTHYTLVGTVPWLTQTFALVGMAGLLAATLGMYGYSRDTLVLFALFFVIVTRLVGHLQSLMSVRTGISTSLPASREICEFLTSDTPHARRAHHAPPSDRGHEDLAFEDRIVFEGVGFAYPRDDGFAIRDLDLSIAARERVGIVGLSGSGKSTLVDLLLEVLTPTQGRITMDGVDQSEVSTDAWRSVFGVVPQEAYLTNGTIEQNIRFGDEQLDEAELLAAARSAMILELIEQLPEGLATVVGDRGMTLSGGQRQRIAIARALANRRQVLVFDEATSALDSISEREVQRAIDGLPGDLTLIIVTHRLASLRGCDKVIVLDAGRIAQHGPLPELLAQPGPFRRLSEEQGVKADTLLGPPEIASSRLPGR